MNPILAAIVEKTLEELGEIFIQEAPENHATRITASTISSVQYPSSGVIVEFFHGFRKMY